jgi:hypothetical protein
MRTTEELERAAYVDGDAKTAEMMARIIELEKENEELEKENEELEEKIANDSLSEWNHCNGDAEEYKDFFYDCFYRLNGHYVAPSISSDYDKSVIFEAIERGEGITK